ncbi:hypothetical protein GCM10017044_09330 [Kordiimonas sediminis]|uniref:Pseudouridine synthase n=1 Tax=Kordiimonas sediminis TaxID=1735581 RepID=A0A919ANZ2_9PROT|nr:pseudouridine synthase [Kordiimonas sediminis]GHF17101.1 hypothetical protein GCM10017044_09330 [Kordiimonas sediminis]
MTETHKTESELHEDDAPKGERIAKALARAGVGSRRDIERMITDGRITVNGEILKTPAVLVDSLKGITVDGNEIASVSDTRLWRMHKRKGTLTTHKDPEGRPTVFDQLPDRLGRVISVGRLDMNTEGLLLLTNDGELARWLELPQNEVVRRYRVRVYGHVRENDLKKLKDGVTIDGVHYGSIDAVLEQGGAANSWLSVAIREGKNREVRRVMEHLGLTVNRLIRTHYGPFSIGTLNPGAVAEVSNKQLHDMLAAFFREEKSSLVAPSKTRDTSKWAKAKTKKAVKPGDKRRRKFKAEQRRRLEGKPIDAKPAQDSRGRKEGKLTLNTKAGTKPKRTAPKRPQSPKESS